MEPCVSNKTSKSSFGDPSPGGAKAWTTLTNHFGAQIRIASVGPSEFALPASIAIEVSLTGFAGRLALPECPQPSWNRLSPWQASWLVVRTFVLFREESSGHTYCVRATGGNARHCYWSDPVVQLCVVKLPLTIRLSSRGQKYIFFLECDGSLSFCCGS